MWSEVMTAVPLEPSEGETVNHLPQDKGCRPPSEQRDRGEPPGGHAWPVLAIHESGLVLGLDTSQGLLHWYMGNAGQMPNAHRPDTSLPSAALPLAPSAVRDRH